jgi:hypothetical protein
VQTGEGMPKGVAIAINDLLDNCAEIKAGEEVVIMAHVDGIYGGDNLVDPQVIAWLQAAVQYRGANASVLWIEEPLKPHARRIPPMIEAAFDVCDVFIIHSFDLSAEEFTISKDAVDHGVRLVRNFATTPSLLNSAWAQTPHELLANIRYHACSAFEEGKPFQLTDDNGTCLEGTIAPPDNPIFPTYRTWRKSGFGARPFPEWVFPPINIKDTSGMFVFDRMLSWWSRFVGIPPVFKDPIRLTIEKNRIKKIEGGEEARRLRQFLAEMEERKDDSVYDFPIIHSGVHPQAEVGPYQCPSSLYRRMIEHGHSCNVHAHIGAQPGTPKYPYKMHMTADIRSATWRVGGVLVHDKGRLCALDHPEVLAVAKKYPDRPGIESAPLRY